MEVQCNSLSAGPTTGARSSALGLALDFFQLTFPGCHHVLAYQLKCIYHPEPNLMDSCLR